MNCHSARANFSKYIEQELCEIERRDVAAHLARCPKCSSDLFAMQKAMSLLRWVPRYEGTPDFEERLMQRIRAEEASPGGVAAIRERLAGLGERWRELLAATVVPAPAVALFAALVLGGLLGAIIAGNLGGPAAMPGGGRVAMTAEITSAPDVHRAEISPGDPQLDPSPAVPEGPERMAEVNRRGGGVEERIDVAPWAQGGERLEAVPEGPPNVSQTEYVLEWVDRNRGYVEPVTAVADNGTVTF